jgi:hypothetical protein
MDPWLGELSRPRLRVKSPCYRPPTFHGTLASRRLCRLGDEPQFPQALTTCEYTAVFVYQYKLVQAQDDICDRRRISILRTSTWMVVWSAVSAWPGLASPRLASPASLDRLISRSRNQKAHLPSLACDAGRPESAVFSTSHATSLPHQDHHLGGVKPLIQPSRTAAAPPQQQHCSSLQDLPLAWPWDGNDSTSAASQSPVAPTRPDKG